MRRSYRVRHWVGSNYMERVVAEFHVAATNAHEALVAVVPPSGQFAGWVVDHPEPDYAEIVNPVAPAHSPDGWEADRIVLSWWDTLSGFVRVKSLVGWLSAPLVFLERRSRYRGLLRALQHAVRP